MYWNVIQDEAMLFEQIIFCSFLSICIRLVFNYAYLILAYLIVCDISIIKIQEPLLTIVARLSIFFKKKRSLRLSTISQTFFIILFPFIQQQE